jgi:3-oxoacyl-[acyl-carrier protein] reductase
MAVSLITGASKGIGRAIADHLTKEGHHVIGLARTKPGTGFAGEFHAVDLSDLEATKRAVDAIVARHAIDHLIHNAGIMIKAPVEDMALADLDAMLTVNLRAAAVLTQAVLPAMKQRKRGRIVTIGSRAALGKAGSGAYAATKAALASFTRN